ncbi:MAG: methylenetetrahydrofolate--tRNA-(uracil(54)-C(5))-methyltransferase (FADH(2)-oxidizing) TrmFO [Deltaproteobacteria bacterium]|nr:MAG: methylenetetrahydrofolate--tRNA-(uracil(54)-C(5))-methyltransferase (FADH(2)-oxidizing) TrmFO [Deltaproteobacteria bacterium]UCF48643.1 MAG: methylenetetrahydrofolate--tRNA-(uracil(54)-C(5))-methyltransferase (FADH(2)-oxidizing) TrmFO [Myxococcales bacterium]
MADVVVVGAGLAGTECAWQLAERGVSVRLIEQKPSSRTPAQHSDHLAELVCSNSFRGAALHNAVGQLKEEMRRIGSLVMEVGERHRVPAGGAFAVDREQFSAEITRRVEQHPLIEVVHEVVDRIPDERPVVLATGPLTSGGLAGDIAAAVGEEHLAYYDAIAPIVSAHSIDFDRAFRASRYDKGGDAAYVNCPLNEEEYDAFVQAVLEAEKVTPREFEKVRYFEGCLPIEVLAARGHKTLAFGCMKPVGLTDPRTGRWPHAVVQLRQEDEAGSAFNMVGFQTRMKWPEQKRVFRMIPGLENAEFERLGGVHRNTFVNSPKVLDDDLALASRPGVYLAGQISGVEGYVESAACGMLLGIKLAHEVRGLAFSFPPPTTMLGGMVGHLRAPNDDFQPSNVMWSMVPPIEGRRLNKRARRDAQSERALQDLGAWLHAVVESSDERDGSAPPADRRLRSIPSG